MKAMGTDPESLQKGDVRWRTLALPGDVACAFGHDGADALRGRTEG